MHLLVLVMLNSLLPMLLLMDGESLISGLGCLIDGVKLSFQGDSWF